MKFSIGELMPFFEVRTGMSKRLDDVQVGKEIVITRYGKPEGALIQPLSCTAAVNLSELSSS